MHNSHKTCLFTEDNVWRYPCSVGGGDKTKNYKETKIVHVGYPQSEAPAGVHTTLLTVKVVVKEVEVEMEVVVIQ